MVLVDDTLGGKALADHQSFPKSKQTLLRVHLQWDWKGQPGSHVVGRSGGNIGG